MDWDMTWENLTEPQEKALEFTLKLGPIRGLTEFQMAEFLLMADKSLWYTQAKSWAEAPPPIGKAESIWKAACETVVEIVDLGYQDGIWWPMKELNNPVGKILILMDFGGMLEQYQQQSLDVVSQGFWIFLDIVCGKGWKKRYQKLMKKAMKKAKGKK